MEPTVFERVKHKDMSNLNNKLSSVDMKRIDSGLGSSFEIIKDKSLNQTYSENQLQENYSEIDSSQQSDSIRNITTTQHREETPNLNFLTLPKTRSPSKKTIDFYFKPLDEEHYSDGDQ